MIQPGKSREKISTWKRCGTSLDSNGQRVVLQWLLRVVMKRKLLYPQNGVVQPQLFWIGKLDWVWLLTIDQMLYSEYSCWYSTVYCFACPHLKKLDSVEAKKHQVVFRACLILCVSWCVVFELFMPGMFRFVHDHSCCRCWLVLFIGCRIFVLFIRLEFVHLWAIDENIMLCLFVCVWILDVDFSSY